MNAPLTQDQLLAMIESLKAENEKLKSQPAKRVTFKVAEKGGLSVYGLGRFPVTLYKSQWHRLFAAADDIKAFIDTNAALLADKA